MKRTRKEIKREIKELQMEIEVLDKGYHWSEDNVKVDEEILDMISKKIDRLEMLQDLIKEY